MSQPDFSARLRKQLDEQWSNITIRRKSAEAILELVENVKTVLGSPNWIGDDLAALRQALRALNEG